MENKIRVLCIGDNKLLAIIYFAMLNLEGYKRLTDEDKRLCRQVRRLIDEVTYE